MKICYLNHDLREHTGAGRFGLQLVERLAREEGVQASVLTMVKSGHPLEQPVLRAGVPGFLLALGRMRSALSDCDIIHALDGYPYGVIGCIAAIVLRKKMFITAVGTGALQALRNPLKKTLLCWAYRRADRVVAVSNYTKREIVKRCPGLEIDVINHAVNECEFRADNEDLSAQERSAVKNLKPYILSVGSGKPRKGYCYSFEAFAKVRARFPGFRYVTVGYDKGSEIPNEFGVLDATVCYKNISRTFLRALYRNAELFMLLPYDDRGDVEGFGFVFLEAAAAGLPVIGTYGCGAEDALIHGKNGFLVEPRNANEAADAAIKILSDASLREKFSKGSVEFARRMNWDKVAERYVEMYKQLTTSNQQNLS